MSNSVNPMMDALKKLTNSSDESLLTILLNQCKAQAVDYCRFSEYDTRLDYIVQQMVCERFSKLYSEGISSRSSSGMSESYTDDFSPNIYNQLRKYRKQLRTVKNVQQSEEEL